jgi:hypothetical protein
VVGREEIKRASLRMIDVELFGSRAVERSKASSQSSTQREVNTVVDGVKMYDEDCVRRQRGEPRQLSGSVLVAMEILDRVPSE